MLVTIDWMRSCFFVNLPWSSKLNLWSTIFISGRSTIKSTMAYLTDGSSINKPWIPMDFSLTNLGHIMNSPWSSWLIHMIPINHLQYLPCSNHRNHRCHHLNRSSTFIRRAGAGAPSRGHRLRIEHALMSGPWHHGADQVTLGFYHGLLPWLSRCYPWERPGELYWVNMWILLVRYGHKDHLFSLGICLMNRCWTMYCHKPSMIWGNSTMHWPWSIIADYKSSMY